MEKAVKIIVTEKDIYTLNNIFEHLIETNKYNNNDLLSVLNKVKRTAKLNNIEVA